MALNIWRTALVMHLTLSFALPLQSSGSGHEIQKSLLRLPDETSHIPTVSISHPPATFLGSTKDKIDTFSNIPYAQPPVGQLRLRPPQLLNYRLGKVNATGVPNSCPSLTTEANLDGVPNNITQIISDIFNPDPSVQSEDCLKLTIRRPARTGQHAKLPVMVYIFGGGFEVGSTFPWDASNLISSSIVHEQPFIAVTLNYRSNGFGFLAGKDILRAGATNLGLRDQRLALQWVQDNIARFGGDPDHVVIWGESAGAASVFAQMSMFDGDHSYNNGELFHGAILDSGSLLAALPVDSHSAQSTYDAVVRSANCQDTLDSLACLRDLNYKDFYQAVNTVPGLFSFSSLHLSYLPRPDYGMTLSASSEVLARKGLFARVPVIAGELEDEGTRFALAQRNITGRVEADAYMREVMFPFEKTRYVTKFTSTYHDDPTQGSPFYSSNNFQLYNQYKRLAAMLGDWQFIMQRRIFLHYLEKWRVPAWTYLGTWFRDDNVLGTFHGTGVLFSYGKREGLPKNVLQRYYINFISKLTVELSSNQQHGRNNAHEEVLCWPMWTNLGRQMLNIGNQSVYVDRDDFRESSYQALLRHNLHE